MAARKNDLTAFNGDFRLGRRRRSWSPARDAMNRSPDLANPSIGGECQMRRASTPPLPRGLSSLAAAGRANLSDPLSAEIPQGAPLRRIRGMRARRETFEFLDVAEEGPADAEVLGTQQKT
jgi:hypothetical protein